MYTSSTIQNRDQFERRVHCVYFNVYMCGHFSGQGMFVSCGCIVSQPEQKAKKRKSYNAVREEGSGVCRFIG